MGATKRCAVFFNVESFSKIYFRKGQNYSKTELTEVLEVIILQNLSKINKLYIQVFASMFKSTVHTEASPVQELDRE